MQAGKQARLAACFPFLLRYFCHQSHLKHSWHIVMLARAVSCSSPEPRRCKMAHDKALGILKLGILRMARGKSETRESDEHIVYREAKTRKISGRPKSLEFASAKLAKHLVE